MVLQKNKNDNIMEKLVSLCKRRGYIFQSSEVYGGINSCYDYGPLGVELKRNIKDLLKLLSLTVTVIIDVRCYFLSTGDLCELKRKKTFFAVHLKSNAG